MIAVVMADTEDVWNKIFAAQGRTYREPSLVLFSGATRSACGLGQAAMGPFYCPADQKAYIDLSFYEDMRTRFRAPGDFAQAYVLAHEVGHHVQNLLGISGQVRDMQRGKSKAAANELSVRLELQADCLAGVWANRADKARNILEAGDVDEALNAASAIGDDRLQKQTQGRVVPESFTHGTSEQRQRWFRTGLSNGDPDACDTFSASRI
jgi:predicted metalloprotease